jgi:hypothetical protein
MHFTADTWNSFCVVPTWLPCSTNHASNFNTLLDIVERLKLVQIRPCRLVKTILPIWLNFFKYQFKIMIIDWNHFPLKITVTWVWNMSHDGSLDYLVWRSIRSRAFTWSLGTVLIRDIGRRISSLLLMRGVLTRASNTCLWDCAPCSGSWVMGRRWIM